MADVELLKIVSLFLLSSVKLVFAPGAAAAAGFSFWETLAITTFGGMTGIMFFYYFGYWALNRFQKIFVKPSKHDKPRKKKSRIFNKRNRWLIKIKQHYGLIGLALLTPCLISIPIGSVVAARFYYHNRLTLPLLLLSTAIWTTCLTYFIFVFKSEVLHQ